jgi:hypothetical protein
MGLKKPKSIKHNGQLLKRSETDPRTRREHHDRVLHHRALGFGIHDIQIRRTIASQDIFSRRSESEDSVRLDGSRNSGLDSLLS